MTRITVRRRKGAIVEAVQRLQAEDIGIDDLGLRRPTLDEVFLTLTGHAEPDAEDATNTDNNFVPEPLEGDYIDSRWVGASYGTFNILWQIEQSLRLELPWLYLGYWIAESPKMAYKARFRPVEMLRGGRWERLTEHKRTR